MKSLAEIVSDLRKLLAIVPDLQALLADLEQTIGYSPEAAAATHEAPPATPPKRKRGRPRKADEPTPTPPADPGQESGGVSHRRWSPEARAAADRRRAERMATMTPGEREQYEKRHARSVANWERSRAEKLSGKTDAAATTVPTKGRGRSRRKHTTAKASNSAEPTTHPTEHAAREPTKKRRNKPANRTTQLQKYAVARGLNPKLFVQAAIDSHHAHRERYDLRREAKRYACKHTGLTPSQISYLANNGFDYAAQPSRVGGVLGERLRHFDTHARDVASQYSELFGGVRDEEIPAAVWELLSEPMPTGCFPLTHPLVLRDAESVLTGLGGQSSFRSFTVPVPTQPSIHPPEPPIEGDPFSF